MKNAGMAGAVALVGIGLISIALSNVVTAPQAVAAPSTVVNVGPEEPQIVWYDSHRSTGIWKGNGSDRFEFVALLRAWSDGTIEFRTERIDVDVYSGCGDSGSASECASTQGWIVISSPNEGLNAAADINFDEVVDGADMGQLLAAWGDAPRSPIPASDCPLGLMQ